MTSKRDTKVIAAAPVTRAAWMDTAVLGGLVLGLGALHLWWLDRFRGGFGLDVDESGYLWFAYHLNDVLEADGLLAMWDRFQGEGWVGPLLPSLTALVELLDGSRNIVHSMSLQLVFFAVVVVSSYGIGRRLLDRRAGLLTAVVVATVPAVTDFVRTYHLVIPSTAMYALATWALLESDRLRHRAWSIAWGFVLGLTLLSRSMMIAFLPALPMAAVWMLIIDDRDRRRRVANLALGFAALGAVALQWYASTWRPIFDYLLDFGYGDRSPGGSAVPDPFSLDYWTDELIGAIDVALYLPLAILLAGAAVLFVAGSLRAVRAARPRRRLHRVLERAGRSDAIVPAFVVVEGYLALTSSSNDGTGFVVPLLPMLVALAVVAALQVPWRIPRLALVVALLATSAFNVVMKADVWSPPSEGRRVELPVLGPATVTSGLGIFHQHLVHETGYRLGPPTHWLPERDKGWLPLYDAVVSAADLPPAELRIYMATTEPLLNSSAIRLAATRSGRFGGIFEPVDTGGDDTVAAYRRFLAEKGPSAVVTASARAWHFGPRITHRRVETAASSLGFRQVARLRVPDGRELRVWRLSA